MMERLSSRRISEVSARRPRTVILAWAALVLVGLVIVGAFLGDALTSELEVGGNPESLRARDLIDQRLGRTIEPGDVIVVRAGSSPIDRAAAGRTVEAFVAEQVRAGAIADPGSAAPSGATFATSRDGNAVAIPVIVTDIDPLVDAVRARDGVDGLRWSITGQETADADFEKQSQEDLKKGEFFFGLPAALVVLLLVFGAVVAGLVPLVLSLVAIVVSLALASLIGQEFALSIFVVNMITGMGLALGIDYTLFILSRFREERRRGREIAEAIGRSAATASRAVVFSGAAFVLAMTGMLLVPDRILRSLAVGAICAGIVAVAAALTLLPAILRLLGDRVDALRLPIVGRQLDRPAGAEGRFWSRIVRWVVHRPGVSLAVFAALLVAGAVPVLGLERGLAGTSTLPDGLPSKDGYVELVRLFPELGTSPARVAIDGDVSSPRVRAAIERLRDELGRLPQYGDTTVNEVPAARLAVLEVGVGLDTDSAESVGAVRALRSELIPPAFAGTGARVLVGGATAVTVDYLDLMERWLPIVFVFVLGLSFILLTVAFRSIVIPVIAIVLNLLSVAVAYGLIVLVFQEGVGADLFGFTTVDAIEAWLPPFLFSVLFGLSMDYQVFLLSRIRERYDQTGDTKGAVIFGVGSTARLITGAALIIVVVFAGFAIGDLTSLQQMGFGIAVALLIDATIIRGVLMPALIALAGRHTWYLPGWLRWLPTVSVEAGPGDGEGAARAGG
jgi:RND superfamily putative drug exporter